MIINIFVLTFLLLLLFILSAVWPPDSPWAPWWNVKRKTAKAICRLAGVTKKDTVYDLGSGDGTALIVAAQEFGARGIGVEIDPLRAFLSKMKIKRAGLSKQINIHRKNFFQHDISSATVVFVYLVPKALQRLLPKLQKELKPGTRIVSFRYELSLPIKHYDKEHDLRLYII